MRLLPRAPLMQWVRLGLCLLTMAVAVMTSSFVEVLPWALLAATLDVLTWQVLPSTSWREPMRMRHRHRATLLFGAATFTSALALGMIGPVVGLLVVVPLAHTGAVRGRMSAFRLAAVALVVATLSALVGDTWSLMTGTAFVVWVLVGALVGLLAAGPSERPLPEPFPEPLDGLPATTSAEPALALEASSLVRRLQQLADSLSTGFDAPAAAEMALQDLSGQTSTTRSAVLVGAGDDPAVPLAMRGADRAPWPDPTSPGSVLQPVWYSQQAILTDWVEHGVSRSLLAVPLPDAHGKRLGILVADRPANTPFTPADLLGAQRVARDHAPTVDLAMVFASLREMAGLEERQRLAREMHDGIAQEVVALGFGLDAVRRSAHRAESDLAPQLDALRHDLSRVLGDLRVHIADLRIAVRHDTGHGAMIGTRLQNFGTTTGIRTRMQLNETGFRLPAHTEVLLYRLFLQVIGDARHAQNTSAIDVSLSVAAPLVEFQIAHNGQTSLSQSEFSENPLIEMGGQISVQTEPSGGVSVRLRMRTRGRSHADLTKERIPQLS